MKIPLMVGIFLGFNMQIGTAATDSNPVMVPDNFSEVAATVGPVVVNISTVMSIDDGGPVFRQLGPGLYDKEDLFQAFFNKFFGVDQQCEFKKRSLGTYFIIDKAGFVVTKVLFFDSLYGNVHPASRQRKTQQGKHVMGTNPNFGEGEGECTNLHEEKKSEEKNKKENEKQHGNRVEKHHTPSFCFF